jgi:hypothetical protein
MIQLRRRHWGASLLALALVCGGSAPGCAQSASSSSPKPVAAEPNDPAAPVEFRDLPGARAKADEVLRRREFRHVEQNSSWALMIARVESFIARLLSRAGALIPRSHWIALALEWGGLALAAAGLLLWVLRVSRQQRLAVAMHAAGPMQVWQKESDDWAARAQAEAGRGDWREAVHCLYWSAIVLLEGQRMWRQNRARTPREYVALLEPGSTKQQALGRLTRVFERIWYGLRPAAETDFRQASAMLDQLRAR